ncbi:MAG: SprT-like domain-containing protein [Bacteriovoracaceae bacterium]
MYIYDETSLAFIQKTESMVREILSEIGIQVRRSRFEFNKYLYPIHIVVFEGSEWGHFNSAYLQIALNRKLIYRAKDAVIRDILRHELAHYLTFIKYGDVTPHGPEFKSICEQYHFPKDVAQATMNLEISNDAKEGDLASEKVLERVKKLLQLAQSSNAHEAELATLKANELLLRHNLDFIKNEGAPIYLDRLLERSRKDAKLTAIYEILKHFIVRTVISSGKNTCCLEVSGSLTNVKLARYVAEFLDREMDHLWEVARKEHNLQGLRAKNSFFLGIARGHDEKMKRSKENFSANDQKALITVEKQLIQETAFIYRRLSHVSSSHQMDSKANQIGIQKGREMNIRHAVEGKGKNLYLS